MRFTTAILAITLPATCVLVPMLLAQENQDRPTAGPVAIEEAHEDAVPKVTAEKPMSFWMKHKLEYSKSLLESLTMGDFDDLAKTGDQLRLLGKIEGFVRRKDPAYRTQLKNFDLSMQELIRHAKEENVEGAALAFNQMTASCVACHSLLRKGIE